MLLATVGLSILAALNVMSFIRKHNEIEIVALDVLVAVIIGVVMMNR
jgi:hypothetical protein